MSTANDHRNSPFNSFLIDDPTPTNRQNRIIAEESITHCISCQKDLRLRSSKILACLHSSCLQCLNDLIDLSGTVYTCPACQHKSRSDTLCENLFSVDQSESNGSSRHCSNCEEGNLADWYCESCVDWLCLQCKNAHARVRLTKDHKVTQKPRESRQPVQIEKLLCQVHSNEVARNFCQDCQTLTCDECQISQHKNHRYSFIDEAVVNQKATLQSLVNKVRDVRLLLNKIQQTRNQQRSEIDQVERQVIDDIKLFGLNMIAEISQSCKSLIDDTKKICEQARTQFSEKNSRFEQYLQNIDHSVEFVNDALMNGSKTALLTSNRLMNKRLDHLLHQNAMWSKMSNSFQLSFSPNNVKQAPYLGSLVQNGRRKQIQEKFIEQNNETEQSQSKSTFNSARRSDDESQTAILLDTSDDFCAVCRCGGELVCCDECPRVYHVDCHVPSLNEVSMEEKWKCGICSELDSSSMNGKRKFDQIDEATTNKIKLNEIERRICEKLILQMYIHPMSVPFHHPVPADCISYHKIITRPIDLGTIKGKLNSYTSFNEFLSDIRLMFQNCATFNRPESEIGRSGRTLAKSFDELLDKYASDHQITLPDRSNKRKKISIQLPDHV